MEHSVKKYRVIQIRNGDRFVPYTIYKCEHCGSDVEEAWPKFMNQDGVYCGECAFILGLISESEYLNDFAFAFHAERAVVHDGEIYIARHKNDLFPFEKTKKKQRNSQAYIKWRTTVFERDKYTCAICGKVGGELNAHHIRPFATNEKLRLDVDNGITLCKECHKRVHKEKDKRWLKEECSQRK